MSRLTIGWSFRCNLIAMVAACGLLNAASNSVAADDAAVRFDVPALVAVHELVTIDQLHTSPSQKVIEVVIPVSSEIAAGDRGNLQEFRFDVIWNRNPFPLCDYSPKTQTFSHIDGTIGIDKAQERSGSIGLKLNGGYESIVSATGQSELGKRDTSKIHYNEIPQHEILVASGSVRRGTGAYFRFHPSRIETLEGGRDLVVMFQVPRSWRAGVLQIECQAFGSRKVLAWNESFETERAFVVPIYLEGDDLAREAAMEFARSEQRLKSDWRNRQSRASHSGLLGNSLSFAATSINKLGNREAVPEQWVHYLIQANDDYLERYRDRLDQDVADAANQFVKARADLLKLSR